MALLTAGQGAFLLRLAREAITAHLNGEGLPSTAQCEEALREKRGVFCTLRTKEGHHLRGCIGLPYPTKPLAEAVAYAAVQSATEDPRFEPVALPEMGSLSIEITVLTPPDQLAGPHDSFPQQVILGKHGLIIQTGHTSGLLLPQVPEEAGWNTPEEFLDGLCQKAGLPPGSWREETTQLFTFEGQIFQEG